MRPLAFDASHRPIALPSDPGTHHLRHLLSRRTFFGSMAGAAGAAIGTGLLPSEVLAARHSHAPKPTSQTVTIGGVTFQLSFFGDGVDPSTIGDFNGFVGVADVQGTGTATGPGAGTLLFDTDMRFMQGEYVGVDGKQYHATFGFV